MLHSCATIGNPEGGPKDEDPPRLISSNPLPNSLNVDKKEVKLVFDELVQIISQNDKVVVSPVQKQAAIIKTNSRTITITFQDTLLENTTYSIDFSDAIADINESNAIDGFSYAFSTGDSIDIHQISGMLLNARDLEPQQNTIVGVHTNFDDTTFRKTPLVRIAKTNDRGQFTIRNLKKGDYQLFALKDANNDYKFDSPTEDIAFHGEIITPIATAVNVTDTIFNANHEVDTIIDAIHYKHTPNDILLSMFNENFQSQYLVKNERPARNRLYLEFAAAADTLPEIRLLGDSVTASKDWYIINRSETNDSITYWLTDTTLMANDSIRIEARYLRTDTTQQLTYLVDTIPFNMRPTRAVANKSKDSAKEKSSERKDDGQGGGQDGRPPQGGGGQGGGEGDRPPRGENMEQGDRPAEIVDDEMDEDNIEDDNEDGGKKKRKRKRDEDSDTLPPAIPHLDMKVISKQTLDIYAPIYIDFTEPIDSISDTAIRLEIKQDTLWIPVEGIELKRNNDFSLLNYKIEHEWDEGGIYKLTVDSASIYGIYGLFNAPIMQEFKVRKLDEYSNLYVSVNLNEGAVVELLNGSDMVVRSAPVEGGVATFIYVNPGDYYLRLFIDSNGNDEYDTGNYELKLQPEEVYYYPEKIQLKQNWDIDQIWNIYAEPIDKQKPDAIKKNKPAKKNQQELEKKEESEEDLYV